MPTISSPTVLKKVGSTNDATLYLAFHNAVQANIVSIVSNGKIVIANAAACKLLGYSNKQLLTKNRKSIFDINEKAFKKMLKERTSEGKSVALVTIIKKSGKHIPCEITSAVFTDEKGIEKSITSISDLSSKILEQKEIDIKKEKIVAGDIIAARLKQKTIDTKKEKIVADNIIAAQSKQKIIDTKKEKIVADNIEEAQSKQEKINIKQEKIVADNIVVAKSKQKAIDIKKEKIVADNIAEALEKSDARLLESRSWIKHISKTSYDVMWDWNVDSGQVYIGDSMEEVFGYKLKNNFIKFEDLKKMFLTDGDMKVEKALTKLLASAARSWSASYQLKRNDGTFATVNSRASIVRDKDGKAIRLIGATQDVSRLNELEKLLDEQTAVKKENTDIFHLAARLSYDGIWDWNLLTNEFFLGEGFDKLFGYSLAGPGKETFSWINYLHPDDKAAVQKGMEDAILSSVNHWEHAYRVIKANGNIANVFSRASIIRDESGKAVRMIGAIHDFSRQQELEEKLEQEIESTGRLLSEYNESFHLMFNSSSDILYDIDIITDKIILSNGYEKEFGYKTTPNMKASLVWGEHLHPADKEAVLADYDRMLASAETSWKYSYRFLRADGSAANIVSSRIIMRDTDGKAYRMIGSMQDVSKQTVLEEKLELEIKLKEKQIADAMLEAKETERSDIGKELHDNVNQLLGVSRLYLEMAKQGGGQSEMHLSRSSEYTLSAIEEIRKLSKGLTTDTIKNLGLCDAVNTLARDTMEVKPLAISCTLDSFIDNRMNEKFKVNLFRIVQEQLNNIIKHAEAKKIHITLSQNKRSILLAITDDGVGFDTTQKRKGIGVDNIKGRAENYNGNAEFISSSGNGCTLNVKFTITDSFLKKE